MRAGLALVLALAASPVEARPWQCVLWPNTCQLDQPADPVEPTPPPPPVLPPAPPPPVVQKPAPAPAKAAPPPKRIKSNFAKAKRKAAALPSWCARIPAGTTMERVDGAASVFVGRALTPAERRQAAACLASKR